MHEVLNSAKRITTSYVGVAQPGSATVLGTVGRRFESYHPHQLPTTNFVLC